MATWYIVITTKSTGNQKVAVIQNKICWTQAVNRHKRFVPFLLRPSKQMNCYWEFKEEVAATTKHTVEVLQRVGNKLVPPEDWSTY